MTITKETLEAFRARLQAEEREKSTVEKYLRDVRGFALWLGNRELTKETAAAWKAHLAEHYAPATVNAALAALNSFLRFAGREDCRVKFLKLQRRAFRDQSQELTQAEYARLVAAAKKQGKPRLALLLETIGGTGIRVSETAYITAEAVRAGKAVVALK
ncbi:MAG: site-specific integrase, partial [Clostridia bacterium]|nr:site-specific integrase [Clostridia bacterium]